jgi:hypothetical protein
VGLERFVKPSKAKRSAKTWASNVLCSRAICALEPARVTTVDALVLQQFGETRLVPHIFLSIFP